MTEYLEVLPQLIASVGLFTQAGACLIVILQLPVSTHIERMSLSFGLGVGAVTFIMMSMSLVGIPLRLEFVLLPWAIVWVAWMLRFRHRWRSWRPSCRLPSCSPLEWMLAALLAAIVFTLILRGTFTPVTSWDGWAIWDLKARAFFYDLSVVPFARDGYGYSHLDYPVLLPLAGTFVYLVLGRVVDGVNILPPLFYAALLVQTYYSSRRIGAARIPALLATLGLALMPNLLSSAQQFLSEIPFLYFLLSGALTMFSTLRRPGSSRSVLLAALLFGCMTQIRPEGILLAAPTAGVLFLNALHFRSRSTWRMFGIFMVTIVAACLPWLIFLRFGATQSTFWARGVDLLEQIMRVPDIVRSLIVWTMTPATLKLYFLIFPMTYLMVLLSARAIRRDGSLRYLLLHTLCLPIPAVMLMVVQPQWAEPDRYPRYHLPFMATCLVLFCILVTDGLRAMKRADASAGLRRIIFIGAAWLMGFGLFIDISGRMLNISPWQQALYTETIRDIPRTFVLMPDAVSMTSDARRTSVNDAQRSMFGQLIASTDQILPEDAVVAIVVASKHFRTFIYWKSQYDLLPRRVKTVNQATARDPSALRALGADALVVYGVDVPQGMGEIVAQLSPRHAVIRLFR